MGAVASADTGSSVCAGAFRLTGHDLPGPFPQKRPHLVLLRSVHQPASHLATSKCCLCSQSPATRTPTAVRSAGYATRPGTMIKTKGGVGLCFTLFGSSFLFITSHFTGECLIAILYADHQLCVCDTHCTQYWSLCLHCVASDHKVSERNLDMQRIAANLALSDESSRKGESLRCGR